MKFQGHFYFTQTYLPSKRHRKPRKRLLKQECTVEIPVLEPKDFPVAFIVKDYKSVCEGMQSYEDYYNCNSEYIMFSEEIRTFNNKLYKPVRVTHGAAISTVFEGYAYLNTRIRRLAQVQKPHDAGETNELSEQAIILEDNAQHQETILREGMARFLLYQGVVWEECGEPMYVINTFGLGNNHGGTGFFIEYIQNSDLSSDPSSFNALQRDEAIAYGKKVATNRGDTESLEGMGEHDIIEVLMPEMVKYHPKKKEETLPAEISIDIKSNADGTYSAHISEKYLSGTHYDSLNKKELIKILEDVL